MGYLADTTSMPTFGRIFDHPTGNGLLGGAEVANAGTKVNSLLLSSRLLIALYSPAAKLKTQLRYGTSEKCIATAIVGPRCAFSAVEFVE
jgi:hypothetical protein